jgi:hypothetical protein
MKKTFTLFVTFLFAISAFTQQPGSLDLSFGNNGISLQISTCRLGGEP